MKKLLLALLASLALSFSAFAAVNLNTATQAELESLDGIGPVKAAAIIDYRKKNGGFKSVDDLEKVDGVGPVTLANVKKDVSVSGVTSMPAATTKPAAKDMKKDMPTAKADKAAPVKEMAKKDAAATPATTVKVDDKDAAKAAKDKEKADKKAAKEAAKAEKDAAKASAKDAKAEKPAAAADTSKADAKAAKDAEKEEKKAEKEKAKADKKAAADAKKAEKAAAKAKK